MNKLRVMCFVLSLIVVSHSRLKTKGEWVRTVGVSIGSLDSDPRGLSILKENVSASDWDEVRSLQTLPPQLFRRYGDSVFVFSSCKYQSCSEKLIFVYDANREIGFYLEATVSSEKTPAIYFSASCTRRQFEENYRMYCDDWLAFEKVMVSEEIFYMRPTNADSLIESRHAIAIRIFKKGNHLVAADTLSIVRRIPKWEFSRYHVDVMNDLGFFYEQSNDLVQAIPILEEVVAWDSRRIPAYLNLADAYFKSGNQEKARVNYQKYVELMEKSGKGDKVPSRVRTFLKR